MTIKCIYVIIIALKLVESKMRIIYIAGPYRSEHESGVFENIMNARYAALLVWANGGVAICPHLNTMLFGGFNDLPDQVWLAGDLEIIRRSVDALWAIGKYETSKGTQREIQEATKLGLPVFYRWEEVRHYLEEDKNDES